MVAEHPIGSGQVTFVTFVAAFIVTFASPCSASEVSELFARALNSRFSTDSSQRIVLTTSSSSGAISQRVVEMALKQIDGRAHALAEIVEPVHLKGTRVLSIEASDRNDDQFIYMPSHERVRRISGAQRADLFFGTDVTLEDFERHYASEFRLEDHGVAPFRGESVRTIAAFPNFDSQYEYALFKIAEDGLTLEIRYFRTNETDPYRTVTGFRSSREEHRKALIPESLEIENRRRGTTTIVEFKTVVARPAPRSLFTTDALRSGRQIPYLKAVE